MCVPFAYYSKKNIINLILPWNLLLLLLPPLPYFLFTHETRAEQREQLYFTSIFITAYFMQQTNYHRRLSTVAVIRVK